MITAVDSNVLVDVFWMDKRFGAPSADSLRKCVHEGRMVACDVVWAEVAAAFPTKRAFRNAIDILDIEFSPLSVDAAEFAGELWRKYRSQGGQRAHVMPDFLIAAHAYLQCDRLLTRDRGFCRKYFTRLQVLDPSV